MTGNLKNILLVEGKTGDASLIAELMSSSSDTQFKLTVADRLESGTRMLSQESFDLVLLDLTLPDSDGLETFEKIRSHAPTVPVIVLTGQDAESIGTAAVQKGAQDYLIKGSVDRPSLIRSVRYAIERSSLQWQILQSHRMESIGRLAGGVAHEFNNLLTPILNYSRMAMTEMPMGSDARENLEMVVKAAQRASELTSQLLAKSRSQKSEPRLVDLNEVILDTGKMLRSVIEENIEFVSLLHPSLELVTADPVQIGQVLTNVIINARDAMPRGGKIIIETSNIAIDERHAEQWGIAVGKHVSMRITDTGIGIPIEILSSVFEPFFTTKEPDKGTGLGLSTCYEIIKQHAGHIEISSDLDKGTTVQMYLPCSAEFAPLQSTQQQEPDVDPGGEETIILAEDEPLVRSMCTKLLRNQGYTVLQAANGEEALRLIDQYCEQKIDLLLTDVVMPQMGGLQLANLLAKSRPEIKIVLMSGYTDEAIIEGETEVERIAFLQKPFVSDSLLRMIREVLDH